MRYKSVREAIFLSRPNRFIARVFLDGFVRTVHVKNTGRCRELLLPGTTVFLSEESSPGRKTAYDLIGVLKPRPCDFPLLINMDSQAPNAAAFEWLAAGRLIPSPDSVLREVRFGDSRIDFCVEKDGVKTFVEVKGVTLEREGIAFFPDAPTARGVKHLKELVRAVKQGYGACVLFIIQMKGVRRFSPNDLTDPAFGAALRYAALHGVRVLAVDCYVTKDGMQAASSVPVFL